MTRFGAQQPSARPISSGLPSLKAPSLLPLPSVQAAKLRFARVAHCWRVLHRNYSMADELADLFASFHPFQDRPRQYKANPRDYGWTFEGCTSGVAPAEKYTRWMQLQGDKEEQQVILYVWPSTGAVKTCLHHPKQGRRPLFRAGEKMTEDDFINILKNPRYHTSSGYRTKKERATLPSLA